MFGLDFDLTLLLLLCLICACAFEFINGFHDTANAVATVIYTNSLKPYVAVIWSGIFNFLGVLFGGTAVAMGIMKLIPPGILLDLDLGHNIVLVLSILLSAIIWNLGTWYLGIPCSSSHTLIGSMLGVGIAFTLFMGDGDISGGVNWGQATKIGLSLLISPALGFLLTFLLMKLLHRVLRKKNDLFIEPKKKTSPPWHIRFLLIFTCTSVSWFHGSNDGQKGVGLIMLILIALVPAKFALDAKKNPVEIRYEISLVNTLLDKADLKKASEKERQKILDAKVAIVEIGTLLGSYESINEMPAASRPVLREQISSLNNLVSKSVVDKKLLNDSDLKSLKTGMDSLKGSIEFVPFWVVLIISISLGIGTMIGWKRIVVTIGEKIGKQHLTYAQGASAELIAAGTIGLASATGLPVSTTQVLSSGIAGSMVASGGVKNLQASTIKNIFIAWILTLPVTMLLSGTLFYLFSLFL